MAWQKDIFGKIYIKNNYEKIVQKLQTKEMASILSLTCDRVYLCVVSMFTTQARVQYSDETRYKHRGLSSPAEADSPDFQARLLDPKSSP